MADPSGWADATRPARARGPLEAGSASGIDFARRRQLLVLDGFLARITVAFGEADMLRGGLVLELRLERARAIKDERRRPSAAAGRRNHRSIPAASWRRDRWTPRRVGDGAEYEGYRSRAECRLAGRLYEARFGIDVASGGVVSGDVEVVTTEDLLGFAGVAPQRLRAVALRHH